MRSSPLLSTRVLGRALPVVLALPVALAVTAAATVPSGGAAPSPGSSSGASRGSASGSSPSPTVVGARPSWATAAAARGDLDAGARLDVTVHLAGPDDAGAAELARQVSTPGSASYGAFLSPAQYRQRFAPAAASADAVARWLRDAGFTVTQTPANHRFVRATGTATAAATAFSTRLTRYAVGGRVLHAPSTAVHVPAALAGVVTGVDGLASSTRLNRPATAAGSAGSAASVASAPSAPPSPAFVNAPPCSAYWGEKLATSTPTVYGATQPYAPCGYTPAQLRGAYGTDALVRQGLDGAGVTVAITDAYASPTIVQDLTAYSARHGLPGLAAGQFRQLTPSSYSYGYDDTANGDQCGEQGWYGEETLDVEAVHAMAPRANIVYVAGASCQDADLLTALTTVVDGGLAQVVTNSWGGAGEPDPVTDRALYGAYEAVFVQAALQGIGMYFSSGDNGDEVANLGVRTPDFPASSPWVTAVGGTSLGVGKGNRYLFETGWGTTVSTLKDGAWTPSPPGDVLYGAGGGTSAVFDEPGYQQGVVPDALARAVPGHRGRVVPDVAAVGDPQTGMLVGQTQTFPDGRARYGEYRIGGTSLASPLVAGIVALADQAYGRAHGFANPALYALHGTSAVRDVVPRTGTRAVVRKDYVNGVDATKGLTVTLRTLDQTQSLHTRRGYDDVTGVGTPHGWAFVSTLGTR